MNTYIAALIISTSLPCMSYDLSLHDTIVKTSSELIALWDKSGYKSNMQEEVLQERLTSLLQSALSEQRQNKSFEADIDNTHKVCGNGWCRTYGSIDRGTLIAQSSQGDAYIGALECIQKKERILLETRNEILSSTQQSLGHLAGIEPDASLYFINEELERARSVKKYLLWRGMHDGSLTFCKSSHKD